MTDPKAEQPEAMVQVDVAQIVAGLRAHAFDDSGDTDLPTHIANVAADLIERLATPSSSPTEEGLREAQSRHFPENTCPASRHVAIIAEILNGGPDASPSARQALLTAGWDPDHWAGSLESVVRSLWECRAALSRPTKDVSGLRPGRGAGGWEVGACIGLAG